MIQCHDGNQPHRLSLKVTAPLGPDLASQIQASLTTEKWEQVSDLVLDLQAVAEVTSADIGEVALLQTHPHLKKKHLLCENVQPQVLQLFKTVGLDRCIRFVPAADDSTPDGAQAEQTETSEPGREEAKLLLAGDGSALEGYCEEAERAKQERDQLRKELEAVRRQLVHSEKVGTLGQMAGGVAHEFNNLLGIMSGYAQLALGSSASDETTHEALVVVEECCQRAKSITEALLNFSRRKKPAKEQVDIDQILAEQTRLLKSDFMAKEIAVNQDLAPARTLADPSQLEQVFINLLTNALHAMPDGGVLNVLTRTSEDEIHVQIADTGVGIAKKDLDKIFTPFFTTKGAIGGSNIKGTGLGLSVSHGIIANHKGRIEVTSEPAEGTTFDIHLPKISPRTPLPEPPPVEQTVENEPSAEAALTVLIVDDEERIRTILCHLVTRMGHLALTAASGPEAIQLCRESKPDVVFLDMLMPGMNGADALLEIRRIHPDIAVIVLTGQAGKPLEAMLSVMKQAGNVELIRKPFQITEIAENLKRLATGQGQLRGN